MNVSVTFMVAFSKRLVFCSIYVLLLVFVACGTTGSRIRSALTDCACYEEDVHFPTPRSGMPQREGFGLPPGALKEMGRDKYLDAMYEGIKKDFQDAGIKLTPIENGFHATGVNIEKVKDPVTKKTKELLVSIDGDISFAHGSSLVTPQARAVIDRVAKAMAAYPDINVTVGGHTDSTGFKQLNVVLSKERAQSTADLLVQLGKIDRKRIVEVKGFADDQKIVDTMLAEVRNRRVEIRMAP